MDPSSSTSFSFVNSIPTASSSSSLATAHETSLIYRLRTDEQHIRMLAVILSLTGGLSLSFLLCVGIFIYWYCHEFKRRGRRITRKRSDKQRAFTAPPTLPLHPIPSSPPQPPSPLLPTLPTVLTSSNHKATSSTPERSSSVQTRRQIPLLPDIDTAQEGSAPSAPPAKEMDESSGDMYRCTEIAQCTQCQTVRTESPPPAYTPASR